MENCRACGGELTARTDSCPKCGQSPVAQESSGSANVIALIVVFVLLAIVGSFAVVPEHGMPPARTAAEAASAGAAGTPAKPPHLLENTGAAAKASRGLLGAQRAGGVFRR